MSADKPKPQTRNAKQVMLTLFPAELELLDHLASDPAYRTRSGVVRGLLLKEAWSRRERGKSLPPGFAELAGETPQKKTK